jgi:hypothetical protein
MTYVLFLILGVNWGFLASGKGVERLRMAGFGRKLLAQVLLGLTAIFLSILEPLTASI